MRDIHAQLRELEVPMMQRTSIMEREAFKLPFRVGASFYALNRSDVRNPRAAIQNAAAFGAEARDILIGDADGAGEGREVVNG